MPSSPPNQAPAPPGTSPRVTGRLAHPSVLLFVILTAQLMVVLDATIVNVALPHIQQDLHLSTSELSWVINAYILTFGGFLLLGARAGDLFGRRRVFLLGMAVFTLSSLVGGLAPTGWVLLGARAVQGLGAALAAPCALSLLTTSFPEGPPRVRAIGLYTAVSAAGGATGLVAGGILVEVASWRWVMFVNVPIGIAVWALGRLVIAETPQRRGQFDLIGAVTCTVGVTAIVYGLVEAGTRGWANAVTLVPLLAGVAIVIGFVWHENRAEEPILPPILLANRTRASANAARALLFASFYGVFYFLSQFLQDVKGYSPLAAGVAFLPMPVSVFVSSQLTSRVLLQRLEAKTVMIAGALISMVGLIMATRIEAHTSYLYVLVSLLLVGFGSGSSLVPMISASLANVEHSMAGAASGIVNVAQQLGAAIGLAVLVTVFEALPGGNKLQPGAGASVSVTHAVDAVIGVAVLFAVAAMACIVFGIERSPRPGPASETSDEVLEESMLLLSEAEI
jgi:EmrB/QacA subfamily drug resistance transporter